MKKLLFMLICTFNLNSFANDLIWATGNDYYNTCSNLEQYNTEKCLAVAAAYFDATLLSISTVYFVNIYHIDIACFKEKYGLYKINAGDAHNMIIGYLKNHPNYRDFHLSDNFYNMFWKNYPPPNECSKTPKTLKKEKSK